MPHQKEVSIKKISCVHNSHNLKGNEQTRCIIICITNIVLTVQYKAIIVARGAEQFVGSNSLCTRLKRLPINPVNQGL